MLAYPGIWTPAAQVLCLTCHGPQLGFGRDKPTNGYESRETAVERAVYFRCDQCGRSTHVDWESVDYLAMLRDQLRDAGLVAEMEQTGGMCPALACGSYRIYYDEDHDGVFCMSEIDSEGEHLRDLPAHFTISECVQFHFNLVKS
jgi:hypothetical protein